MGGEGTLPFSMISFAVGGDALNASEARRIRVATLEWASSKGGHC